jgi:multidrug efflux system membrane fusion protein
LLVGTLVSAGCTAQAGEKPAKAPEVTVARPVVRDVMDHEDFTGRAEAVERVELRARVTGFLSAIRFKEGERVKKGDLLFEIDPRPYKAQLNQAQSQVDLHKATLKLARGTLARDQALAKSAPGSVSQQQLDQDRAAMEEAEARVKAAEANVDIARLNLDFCNVTAPIDGRIGRALVGPGNLVNQDQTSLAVLVSEDLIYVYFDMDERTFLRLLLAQPKGKAEARKLPVAVGLAGEEGFPHRGVLNFTDNRVNPDTGTISMRATLPNKNGLMLPGMFVRVRLALGAPYKALLVREHAIASDLDRKYVYVVDGENKVQVRIVRTGSAQSDGLRAIAEGLQPDDRVVIGRLTGVRAGMTVHPKDVDMQAPPQPKPAPPPPRASTALAPAGSGIRVDASYPGASAETVADAVRFQIEQQVNGIENLRHLRSRCTSDGKYSLEVAFASGVDAWRAQVQVQNRVALALPVLPAAVTEAGVQIRRGSSGVLAIATLTAADAEFDRVFLSNYASIQIRDELARLAGVSDVAVLGGSEHGLRIRLDTDRLSALRLSVGDVVGALRKEKWDRGEADARVADLIVKSDDEGRVVRLRDVGNVQFGAGRDGDEPRNEVFQDNKAAIALAVYLTGDVGARKVRAALEERLRELRPRLPRGLVLDVPFDFAANFGVFAKMADADHVLFDLDFAAGAGSTADVLQKGTTLLRAVPAVKRVLALSENPLDAFGGRPCLLIQLNSAKSERAEVLRLLRGQLGALKDVTVRLRDLSAPGSWPRGGYPIDLALSGPDAAEVRDWADKLADRLRQSKELTDVWVSPDSLPRPGRFVDVQREAAAVQGVALADIYSTMEAYSGSLPVARVVRFGQPMSVEVQAGARGGDWADGLKRLKVRNAKGQMVPLGNLVTVREVEMPQALDFLDFYPMMELTANIAPGVTGAAAQKLCTQLADEVRRELGLTPDYRLTWLQAVPRGR